MDDPGVLPRKAMNVVLDSGSFFWRGDGRAAFDSSARAAAVEAERIAAGRTWGDLHHVVAEHPLAAAKLLDRLVGLNVGPAPAGGSPTTVNVSHYTSTAYPITADYGPSQRHVVDMGDVDGAGGFILPTGQSGIPFSGHYADQWPLWLGGGLWRVPLDRAAAEARTVHRQRLQPSGH
jgi:penicillin amidase